MGGSDCRRLASCRGQGWGRDGGAGGHHRRFERTARPRERDLCPRRDRRADRGGGRRNGDASASAKFACRVQEEIHAACLRAVVREPEEADVEEENGAGGSGRGSGDGADAVNSVDPAAEADPASSDAEESRGSFASDERRQPDEGSGRGRGDGADTAAVQQSALCPRAAALSRARARPWSVAVTRPGTIR